MTKFALLYLLCYYFYGDLYIYEKELNKLGVETRIARNIEDNVLSLAILSVPEIKEE